MNHAFDELITTIKKLRSPEGCPWDKEQTFESLTPFVIEEAYELVDAIHHQSFEHICNELGDVLLQVVLHSIIAEEQNRFTIIDVITQIREKMIRRHPHVFGDTQVNGVSDVWKNWEAIKKTEATSTDFALDSVPKSLPALFEATKLQKKASRLGFDWPDVKGPLEKVEEELSEMKAELHQTPISTEALKSEIGDLLFSIVNLCRKLSIQPEEALKQSNHKFRERFRFIETKAKETGKSVNELSLEQLDQYWETAKTELSPQQE